MIIVNTSGSLSGDYFSILHVVCRNSDSPMGTQIIDYKILQVVEW
jgi:hypothetical protein